MAVTFLTNEDEQKILNQTAPGGYGWGETKAAAMPDGDANSALETGLYRAGSAANVPADCNLVFVQAMSGGYIYQTAYCTDGAVAMRSNDHDDWSKWEWIKEKKKSYEHIATITVVPDAEGSLPQHVIFSADSKGNAFALTDFIIKATAGFVDGNKSTLYMTVNKSAVITNGAISSIGTTPRTFTIFFRSECDGCKRVEFTSSLSASGYFNSQATIADSRLVPPFSGHDFAPITQIDLYTILPADGSKAWVEGSTFELWGIRA